VLCPPVALGLSVIGVIRDQRKWYALAILVVSAAFTILLLWSSGILHHPVPAFRPGVGVPH
jgi:hypothetical protein